MITNFNYEIFYNVVSSKKERVEIDECKPMDCFDYTSEECEQQCIDDVCNGENTNEKRCRINMDSCCCDGKDCHLSYVLTYTANKARENCYLLCFFFYLRPMNEADEKIYKNSRCPNFSSETYIKMD